MPDRARSGAYLRQVNNNDISTISEYLLCANHSATCLRVCSFHSNLKRKLLVSHFTRGHAGLDS